MVEPPKQMLDIGRHHPRLRPEQYYDLHYNSVETPQCPSVRALQPQGPSQLIPDLPGIPKFGYGIRLVIVGCCKDAPQVIKRRHCFQWPVVIP